MNNELCRKLFEALGNADAAKEYDSDYYNTKNDSYYDRDTQGQWIGFQAACNMFLPFVEIIEDDAEPQVGDLLRIQYRNGTIHLAEYKGLIPDFTGKLRQQYNCGDKRFYIDEIPQELKILTRNGKYAIRESELMGEK